MAIDIYFGRSGEFDVLSNLGDKWFIFDGERVRTIEGVLQSLKEQDREKQKLFWPMFGPQAKKAGKGIPWQQSRLLWWKGVPMDRDSEEYQEFLDRLYGAAYAQSETFRKALIASREQELRHSIGSVDPEFTILTQDEFLERLYTLRTVAIKNPA